MTQFDTGATRSDATGKLDYEGFLSPLVLKRYAEYMHRHRIQADGKERESDNWQKGMPKARYVKSAWRHFFDWWAAWRRGESDREAACALLFNVMGWLHEELRVAIEQLPDAPPVTLAEAVDEAKDEPPSKPLRCCAPLSGFAQSPASDAYKQPESLIRDTSSAAALTPERVYELLTYPQCGWCFKRHDPDVKCATWLRLSAFAATAIR